ncbi:MAG: DUF1634 domain-containing protein [Planctomycetota bacterium]
MTLQSAQPDGHEQDPRVRRVELLISALLRTGVAVSLALIVFGTVLTFLHHPSYLDSATELQRLTHPHGAIPHTLRSVRDGLLAGRGQGFVSLGLLLLIATPILRVAVSILAFLYQRDRIFVLITTTVLMLLLLSFILGTIE